MRVLIDVDWRILTHARSRCLSLLALASCLLAGCSSDVTKPNDTESFQLVSYGTQAPPIALSRTSGVSVGGPTAPDCTTFLTGMLLTLPTGGDVTRAESRRTECTNGTTSSATVTVVGRVTMSASDIRIEFAASATSGVERYMGHRTATQIVIDTRELETPMVSPSGGSGTLVSRDDTSLVFERRP